MIFHVGTRVGALVDGQLPSSQAERLWAHVHHCGICRAAVEREGWVKRELAQLSWAAASSRAVASRPAAATAVACAWAGPPPGESRPRRYAGLAAIGAGSVSAAMFGIFVLGASTGSTGRDDRLPVSNLDQPVTEVRTGVPGDQIEEKFNGAASQTAAWVRMGL